MCCGLKKNQDLENFLMDASTGSRRDVVTLVAPSIFGGPAYATTSLSVRPCDVYTAKIAVLMCTFNGESFLADQLQSFERQTHSNWTLLVSDDSSRDGTLALLDEYAKRWGESCLKVFPGPQRGFVANFLSLTCRSDIDADFFAWSDQDDIWSEDKLQVALRWLQSLPAHIPALYCGRTQLVCEAGVPSGMSPRFAFPPRFANALVQSIAGGNTMVFNRAAHSLICEAGADVDVPSHDWWLYQLISGAGGLVHYDPIPRLQYRQHDENLIGSNSSWSARLQRLQMLFQGRFCEWNEQNIQALETMRHRLTPEHQETLGLFKTARVQKLPQRLLGFMRAGLYRQTLFGNLGLIFATLLKKI